MATGISKSEVIELQRPAGGEVPPIGGGIELDGEYQVDSHDGADMARLGRKQELRVSLQSRPYGAPDGLIRRPASETFTPCRR